MPKSFSFRFPDDLATKVETESHRKNTTESAVIRLAVEEYFNATGSGRTWSGY